MATGPTTSTLRWAQKEARPIAQGLSLIFQSQLGYEGRRMEKECSKKMLQTAVCGGTVVDPLNPSTRVRLPDQREKKGDLQTSSFKVPNLFSVLPTGSNQDVMERTNVVAVGIQTFARLLAQGKASASSFSSSSSREIPGIRWVHVECRRGEGLREQGAGSRHVHHRAPAQDSPVHSSGRPSPAPLSAAHPRETRLPHGTTLHCQKRFVFSSLLSFSF